MGKDFFLHVIGIYDNVINLLVKGGHLVVPSECCCMFSYFLTAFIFSLYSFKALAINLMSDLDLICLSDLMTM